MSETNNRYRNNGEVIDAIRPYLEGKTVVSRGILRHELRKAYGDKKQRSLLCAAIQRGILIPHTMGTTRTVKYEVRGEFF